MFIAPPHGIGAGSDTMPNGCPKGHDPIKTVDKMATKGITLYSVGCEPSILPYKEFFSGLAFKTGGQYVPLRNAKLLAKVIVGGAVEEISLERLMKEVELEVQEQRDRGIHDEKILAEAVQSKLSSKGNNIMVYCIMTYYRTLTMIILFFSYFTYKIIFTRLNIHKYHIRSIIFIFKLIFKRLRDKKFDFLINKTI